MHLKNIVGHINSMGTTPVWCKNEQIEVFAYFYKQVEGLLFLPKKITPKPRLFAKPAILLVDCGGGAKTRHLIYKGYAQTLAMAQTVFGSTGPPSTPNRDLLMACLEGWAKTCSSVISIWSHTLIRDSV